MPRSNRIPDFSVCRDGNNAALVSLMRLPEDRDAFPIARLRARKPVCGIMFRLFGRVRSRPDRGTRCGSGPCSGHPPIFILYLEQPKLDCPVPGYTSRQTVDFVGYNCCMTTINTIEDLARILQEQPTWAEALRSLILGQDLLDLPARLDKFIEEQQEVNRELRQFKEEQRQFNEEQRQFNEEQLQFNKEQRQFNEEQRQFNDDQGQINQGFIQRLNSIEGRLGNLEGGEFERKSRAKALARSMLVLGFESPYIGLTQDGVIDPRLTGTIDRAVRAGSITREQVSDLYGVDLIISANDNRHAVIEVSVTADNDDIRRAKTRAAILAEITGGDVSAVVMTANLSPPQRRHAEVEAVTVFVAP